MAALAAVLSAVARSAWRSLRGVGSFTGNNLFAVIVLLMAEEPLDRPSSTAVFYLFIGLLYTVPLALELERRVPRARLELWPLGRGQRAVLTIVNLLMNPVLAMAVLFAMLSRHRAVGSALLLAGLVTPAAVLAVEAVARLVPARRWSMPRIPMLPGRLGGLVLSHVRELLLSLDLYLAALLAVGGVTYRLTAAHPDPAAALVMGGLIVVMSSTLAQAGGAFDPEASEMRMRLLPVSGVDLLLARDVAWLLVVLVLISTYPLMPCLAGALGALAVGHSTVGQRSLEQKRGHFAAGRLGPTGLYQIVAIVVSVTSAASYGWPALLGAGACYTGSLWWFGRQARY